MPPYIRINVDFDRPRLEIPEGPARKEIFPRRLKITQKLLDKYGFSQNCEGCARAAAGSMEPRGHSEACGSRTEARLEEDEEGREIK